MNFRLVWADLAVADLARIYSALLRSGGDAGALASAAARIDQLLETNPAAVGESRAMNERVTFEAPLTVYFEVHQDEGVVIVTRVRYFAPRT